MKNNKPIFDVFPKLTVFKFDKYWGLLYTKDGFIQVALKDYYGENGEWVNSALMNYRINDDYYIHLYYEEL